MVYVRLFLFLFLQPKTRRGKSETQRYFIELRIFLFFFNRLCSARFKGKKISREAGQPATLTFFVRLSGRGLAADSRSDQSKPTTSVLSSFSSSLVVSCFLYFNVVVCLFSANAHHLALRNCKLSGTAKKRASSIFTLWGVSFFVFFSYLRCSCRLPPAFYRYCRIACFTKGHATI